MSSYLLIPLAGFLGSFHCAAMCGPFVSFYSISGQGHRGARHLAYHLGRLLAYVTLGLIVGWFGQGLLYLSTLLKLQKFMLIALGLGMILIGISHYLPGSMSFTKFSKPIHKMTQHFTGPNPTVGGIGLLGLFSTLLPCGFLYSFVFAAGASGHPLSGFLIMLGFWLGTVPMLLGVGVVSQKITTKFATTLQNLTPLCLIFFGILALLGKWQAFPLHGMTADSFCFQ